jgi:acyl-CoA synthetase (AMP-forming)/AMP-acid ligase II
VTSLPLQWRGDASRHPLTRLRRDAETKPRSIAYRFVGSRGGTVDEPLAMTYAELDCRARAVAVELRLLNGQGSRAAVVCAQGPDYVVGFLACLYAGVVAVPLCRPDTGWGTERLASVLPGSRVDAIITDAPGEEDARSLVADHPALDGCDVVRVDRIPAERADLWHPPALTEETVAYLQFTSGSTSAPRGVRITHGNLAQGVRQCELAFRVHHDSVTVTWLPLYHDLGLMLGLLGPLGIGASCVLMSPHDFIRNPLTYLRAITRWQGTITSGPSFNLDMCVDRVREPDLAALDLSSLEVLGNGGEGVRASALRRFNHRFAPCGFRPEAHTPSYGLAEATLVVTSAPFGEPPRLLFCDREALIEGRAVVLARATAADPAPAPRDGGTVELVSCGVPVDQRVLITDADGRVLPELSVGEIWACGPNVSPGYTGAAAADAFTDQPRHPEGPRETGPWLRTGDLGFLDEGQLYVTGRAKDVIIVNGRNHWPGDLEPTVENAEPVFRPNRVAAFRVDVDDRECLVVAAEIDQRAARQRNLADEALERSVRGALLRNHGVELHELVCVRAGSLPMTTSGKLRRAECRDAYLAGSLARRQNPQPRREEPALVEPPPEGDRRQLGARRADEERQSGKERRAGATGRDLGVPVGSPP